MDKLDNINKAIYDQYRAVVLCANFSDCNQVLTTIKSIVCHNRFIKFYVINSDFPTEWFVSMQKRLAKLDCQIVNARVDSSHISQYQTNIHYSVFLRYFTATFVQEDQALYSS